MARLIISLNNKILGSHPIMTGEQLTIGRHPDNRICIENSLVSAHHAEIRFDGQKALVKDLDSQNGTFVNDEQIAESQLGHQDWITIGKHICIVDLYNSLSLESAENELKARSSAVSDAEQTMLMNREDFQPGYLNFDYLFFLNSPRQDYDLSHRMVRIGKNRDAEIKIGGIWSLFAGKPSATITKSRGGYILEHVGGLLKPKINGIVIKGPTRLKHQDTIKIGSLEMQIRCIRRTLR